MVYSGFPQRRGSGLEVSGVQGRSPGMAGIGSVGDEVFIFVLLCHCLSNAAMQCCKITCGLLYPVSILRPECEKLQMAITQNRVIRSTSCLVIGWVF